jgi:hypothetical protein
MTAKEKVLAVHPDAKSIYHNCGMTNSYWTVEAGGLELGRAYCGAMTDSSAWKNAAESLPAQTEQKYIQCCHCCRRIAKSDQVCTSGYPCTPYLAPVEARYEASDEYIRGFNRCKELAEYIVDEHLGFLDRIGHLDPITSVAEPKPTPSSPGCEESEYPGVLPAECPKCGEPILGEGWNPKTGVRYFSHKPQPDSIPDGHSCSEVLLANYMENPEWAARFEAECKKLADEEDSISTEQTFEEWWELHKYTVFSDPKVAHRATWNAAKGQSNGR